MPTITPVSLLSEKIYNSLRYDIAAGALSPGQRLNTDELARDKKVSQTPIREALRLLAMEGLVELQPNKGACVRKLTLAEAKEIFLIREHLEPACAANLARRGCEKEVIGKLKAICRDYRQAKNMDEMERADYKFHVQIIQASGLQFITNLLNNHMILLMAFRPLRHLMPVAGKEAIERFYAEHMQIVEAIEQGDVRLAEERMQSHLKENWSQSENTTDSNALSMSI